MIGRAKRSGRAATDNAREHRVGLHFSATELAAVEAAAEAAGMPVAVFCRVAALQVARTRTTG